ncbi:MAG: hypothetical protein KKA62_00190 [Nanoarchaeota archaeon]|nr:hypothetical protein [Nanoarchaeota archaeon]MBU1644309.1 hypothetical protein [Nanoarchaeota archaeon]MBU1976356.1 hypothetical protein [Nanoarchaeota archaeon]
MNSKNIKILGYAGLIILLLNLVLFALRIINGTIFWAVIVIGAIFAYVILPRLKK